MFMRINEYIRVVSEWQKCQGVLAEQSIRLAHQETTIDWLRNRINALEKERAILLKEVTHLSFPTPEIATGNRMSVALPTGLQLPSFEDVGDDGAKALGIDHDKNGELVYT